MGEQKLNSFAQLMQIYGKENDFKGKICVFDVEPTVKYPRVFEFAWGFIAADTEQKTFNIDANMKSYLVYEAIINNKMMMEIANWKKIKMATDDSSLAFYKKLQNEGWFSNNDEDDLSKEDIEYYANNAYAMNYDYQVQKKKNEIFVLMRKADYWKQGRGAKDPRSAVYLPQRQSDIRAGWINLNMLKQKAKREAILRESIAMGKNDPSQENKLLSKIAEEAYNESKNIKILNDQNEKRLSEIRNLLGSNFRVETWQKIITEFENDFKMNEGVLVLSYNINADKRFIRNSSRSWGTADINWDNITNLCLMHTFNNFMRGNEKVESNLVKFIIDEKNQNIESIKNFKTNKRISPEGKFIGGAISLAVAYPALLNISEYTQAHSAEQDVREAMEVLIETLKPSLDEYIKNSLKNK